MLVENLKWKSSFHSVSSEPCVGSEERIARNTEFISISISWERTWVFKTWYRLNKNKLDLILYSSQSNMNEKNLELCPSPEIRGVNVLNGMPRNTEHTK